AAIELGRAQRGCSYGCLRLKVFQLLETDHAVAIEPLAALEIAFRLLVRLPCLLDFRRDFRLLDLGELLTATHSISFIDGNASDDAGHFERELNLIGIGDDAVRMDGRYRWAARCLRDSDRCAGAGRLFGR